MTMRAMKTAPSSHRSVKGLKCTDLTLKTSPHTRRKKRTEALSTIPESVYRETSAVNSPVLYGTQASRLLTKEGEQWIFREMDSAKLRAEELQQKQPSGTDQTRELHDLLENVKTFRAAIVESNLRLVLSLARKYSHSESEFDELVSEGNLILLNAVDKFDVERGFRFSTYATHSIQRHFFRFIQRKQKQKLRETSVNTGVLSETTPDAEKESPLDSKLAEKLISKFDEYLDEREAAILRDRFGLNENKSPATLKAVSERVGLSKERVRQLQIRAIEKLQDLAIQLKLRLEPTF